MKTYSKISIIIVSILISLQITAQNKIKYAYDKNGNRVQKKLIVCTNCPPDNQGGRMVATEKDTVQALAVQRGLNVFPNPTQDKVMLTLSNLKDNEMTSVSITDENGKIIYSQQNLQTQNEINMSSFNNGSYFFRVIMGKDVMVYKVMKLQ